MDYRPLKALEVPIALIIAEMEAVLCDDMARKFHFGGGYCHEAPTCSETLAGKLDTIPKKGLAFVWTVREAVLLYRFQQE